jgi:hypothetical protein
VSGVIAALKPVLDPRTLTSLYLIVVAPSEVLARLQASTAREVDTS